MDRVLVLAPMSVELQSVARRLGLRRQRPSGRLTGRFADLEVVAVLVGVGTVRSAQITRIAIRAHEPDRVVIAGVAGGLREGLRVGSLVVPEVVVDLDKGGERFAHPLGNHPLEGRLVTSGVLHPWSDLEDHARDGALAVDMETGAIAEVCEAEGVPWTAFRGVSDIVRDATVDATTLAMLNEDGTTNVAAAIRRVARRPRSVGVLARLGRDTSVAMDAVAEAVAASLSIAGGGDGSRAD